MVLRLLIDAVHPDETRVVIADNARIHDFDFVTSAKKQVKGNIYLAKITRVEPSLQAAFVEYGSGKQGFLPFAEIHPDYYQIPTADRKRLMEEAEQGGEEGEDSSTHPEPVMGEPATHGESAAQTHESQAEASETKETDAPGLPAHLLEQPSLPPQGEEDQFKEETGTPAMAEAHPAPALHSDPVADATQENSALPMEASQDHNRDHNQEPVSEPAQDTEAGESTEIETLASDEDAVRQSRPASFSRRYKIQEVIKRNQIVLVQVIKEERGNKGVSLTTFISLAGRYCVLMPNSPKGGGISRKIMSGEDRKRLKEISSELKTVSGMSAIIRTAGIDRTRAEIKRDYEYLVKLWETIRTQTLASTAPALIYEEGDLIKRTIRDLYSTDIEEIIVEGEDGFNQAKNFLKMILPSHAPRVKLYKENVPLFYAYNIEDQLSSMYDPVVKLRSGGYIVLNPTEALISIDVNSGRSTGERNIEETATKTNLEAVAEIARQLRLRDLAGLIVIDLIDMMDSRNRRAVERALKDALKLDRAKIQFGRISPFGLLEMSRQRLRPSLSETSTMPCTHCQGKGIIRSDASVTIQLIRAMEKEAAGGALSELKLTVSPAVALHLLNTRRDAVTSIEQKYGLRILVLTDGTLPQGVFRLEKAKSAQGKRPGGLQAVSSSPVSLDQMPMDDLQDALGETLPDESLATHNGESDMAIEDRPREERGPRRGKRGGRGRRGGRLFTDRSGSERIGAGASDTSLDGGAFPQAVEPLEADALPREAREPREPRGDGRPRGERGGRGRRPRRFRDQRAYSSGDGGNAAATGDGSAGSYAPAAGQDNYAPAQAAATQNNIPERWSSDSMPMQTPRPERISEPHYGAGMQDASIPPLSQQASQEAKAKKGWWRRIVES